MRFFGNNNEKKLFDAIEDGNVLKVKSILKINDNKKINVNKKIKNGEYPLLKAIKDKNIELIKLLIEYANQNNIVLELNEKDENGNYPLLLAIIKNNFDIVKLLKEYANQHNIVLELNEKDKNGSYPLLWAVHNDSIKIVKLLMKYANKQNILLELNEKDNEGDNPLSLAISKSNIDLQLNDINKENKTYYWAMDNNNNEMAKLLIEYAREHNIISELLIENAHNHNISLEYNKNDYEIRDIIKNNSEIKKLLDYEKGKNIRLDRERLENERKKREKLERERLERENIRREREILEKERLERERMERERLERERMERERLERERMERERLERERMERERLKRERMERERLERERLEGERMERERLEGERLKNERKKNRNDGKHPKTPTLVIAINNFEGQEYDHLDIEKDEFLMVTDWNCGEEGWVCGYRKDNEKEKGIFPRVFVKIYKNEDKEKGGLINEITPEYRIKYENKINQLRSLNEMKVISTDTNIKIHRNNLFNDAFNAIMSKTPQELKKRLRIEYENERGIDAGGLLRDFFYQISKEIGNPNYSLFQYSHDNSYELEINPNSGMVDPYHLKYFRFIGRMIGLSIFHKQYLSVCFTLLFYKKLLNIPLEISDLEYVDPQMFRNLQQLKDNDGAENLYLTFEMEMEDCFGNHKTIELKPNGGNIDVTDANKNEYIDLVIKNKLNNTNDKEQLNALKQGFYEIIPQNINTIIDEIDLKFLISGINELDVEDWENNTSYEGYNKNDITIKLFWKCVKKFSNENRTKLLIFATGNSQVPITGFKDLQGSGGRIQRFKLKKVGTEDDLPISHTCFNRIDLPPYTSAYVLKRKLLQAISEGIGGFSME